jgi:ribonucleoside-diphosphate reductase alpha chain/ribonucleoside-triphosphate reductase
VLNIAGLINAQKLSARAGMRMTLVELESMPWSKDPKGWAKVQSTDRLIGTSVTGWKDAIAILGYDLEAERDLLRMLSLAVKEEVERYSSELRISKPLLDTTVKPEGTLSLVAVNPITKSPVSSGLHLSHSPYYIRRIRINAMDPLAKTVQELGWLVHPEVGTPGATREEQLANARTLVIEFPIASGAKRSKEDSNVEEQFRTYFDFQKYYTRHNSSNTIDIKDGEWAKAEEIVYSKWDDFTAVSFLAYSGHSYQLAPLEAITKEKFEELKAAMAPFDMNVLNRLENPEDIDEDIEDPNCANGACGVR